MNFERNDNKKALTGVDRIYAWDNPWRDFPLIEIPKIKQIISSAKAPKFERQELLFGDGNGEKQTDSELVNKIRDIEV